MSFNPTHVFRGLELERGLVHINKATYYDAEGNSYVLPMGKVAKIQLSPQPGEVWKFNADGSPA